MTDRVVDGQRPAPRGANGVHDHPQLVGDPRGGRGEPARRPAAGRSARPGRPPVRPSTTPTPTARWPGCRPRPARPAGRAWTGCRPRRPPAGRWPGRRDPGGWRCRASRRCRRTRVTRVSTSSGGNPMRAAMSAATVMPDLGVVPGKALARCRGAGFRSAGGRPGPTRWARVAALAVASRRCRSTVKR